MTSFIGQRPEQVFECFTRLLSSVLTTDGEINLPSNMIKLPDLFSPSSSGLCYSMPSLALENKSLFSSASNISIEADSALKLATSLTGLKDDISTVPSTMALNISLSLMKLLESRLRCSTVAFLKQSINIEKEKSPQNKLFVSLLSSPNAILWSAAVTSVHLLPIREKDKAGNTIFPILFDIVVDFVVMGNVVPVNLRTSGTISGTISDSGDGLTSVKVVLDTLLLLRIMMRQARVVVRKAVALAAAVSSTLVERAENVLQSDVNNMSLSRSIPSLTSDPSCMGGTSLRRREVKNKIHKSVMMNTGNENEISNSASTVTLNSSGRSDIILSRSCSNAAARLGNNRESFCQRNWSFSRDDKKGLLHPYKSTISKRSEHSLPHKKRRMFSCPDLAPSNETY